MGTDENLPKCRGTVLTILTCDEPASYPGGGGGVVVSCYRNQDTENRLHVPFYNVPFNIFLR